MCGKELEGKGVMKLIKVAGYISNNIAIPEIRLKRRVCKKCYEI